MQNQSSFILVPRVYNQPCLAELHLVIVNDGGVKLGVIASATTAYHVDGKRYLSCEALTELQSAEVATVVEHIKREQAAGNIEKAFAFDIAIAIGRYPELDGHADLFQITANELDIYVNRDRLNKLLEAVRDEYCGI